MSDSKSESDPDGEKPPNRPTSAGFFAGDTSRGVGTADQKAAPSPNLEHDMARVPIFASPGAKSEDFHYADALNTQELCPDEKGRDGETDHSPQAPKDTKSPKGLRRTIADSPGSLFFRYLGQKAEIPQDGKRIRDKERKQVVDGDSLSDLFYT